MEATGEAMLGHKKKVLWSIKLYLVQKLNRKLAKSVLFVFDEQHFRITNGS